jgi:peptidoglycan-N-acetylglucosamine deacetylase
MFGQSASPPHGDGRSSGASAATPLPTEQPASPTPTPTFIPSSPSPQTPVPTPTGARSRLVAHGDRASGQVALTFTVGYRLEPAAEILELLRERGVAATIFMSGVVFDQGATRAAAERVLEIIAERPDLFQLGQHGYSATELPGLTPAAALAEVRDAEQTLARHGAPDLRPYFSPPGGAQSPAVLDMLGSLGYSTTVLWDVDPLDWKPPADGGPSADEVAARVLGRVQGGSIVLMHLGGWNTLPALPQIIDGLAARGLQPVTVAELLAD